MDIALMLEKPAVF